MTTSHSYALPVVARKRCFFFTALLVILLAAAATSQSARASDGFTEPYRTISVAAPEAGIIGKTFVEEGATVRQGEPLVQLDVALQQALLAIAEVGKQARGRVDAAQAEVNLRKQMLTALEDLRATGHARAEELERARADLAIAQGELTAAREQQQLKQLEYQQIRVQIDRRTVRAPLDGVVTKVLKRSGEFTAPNDPNLMVLVQLDPLFATFDLASSEAAELAVGQPVSVRFGDSGADAEGQIDYVSPVIDAESGTVAIKVRLPNPDGQLQSGQACTFND
ncbi:MAG: efflux RND transporter periplasmic adaptor subunit [Bythopirellula sp.]